MSEPVILASSSPRRKQLLEWAEIQFEIMVQPTSEMFPPGLTPTDAAIYIAHQKALAVQPQLESNRIILAADTIVVLDNEIIGKPTNRNHAIRILTQLQNQTHRVVTGVAILKGLQSLLFADTTAVTFHPLTLSQIEFYVDKYQPYDKAGAYAIQEWIGVTGIAGIQGDFYNVMGLPVSRVVQELQKFL